MERQRTRGRARQILAVFVIDRPVARALKKSRFNVERDLAAKVSAFVVEGYKATV